MSFPLRRPSTMISRIDHSLAIGPLLQSIKARLECPWADFGEWALIDLMREQDPDCRLNYHLLA